MLTRFTEWLHRFDWRGLRAREKPQQAPSVPCDECERWDDDTVFTNTMPDSGAADLPIDWDGDP